MRIASYNVENLFSRPRAMNLDTWKEGSAVLEQYTRLNALLQKETYTAADKVEILKKLDELGLTRKDESEFVLLRQNKGRLLRRPKSGPIEVVANGRSDWIGWLELKDEAVNETATSMTARVIRDVNADLLAVVEAEDRIALRRFNEQLLRALNATYDGIMLIDGNDDRGIDVGLMTRVGYTLETICSHVDDMDGNRRIFSRDCPEFTVRIGDDTRILILVNHFKSKGHGTQAESNARRRAQAKRVREIYEQRRADGMDLIVIAGDLNDTPESQPLAPLLSDGSDLKDISEHPQFDDGGRPGTFGTGTASNKIDYLLLSPALFSRARGGGIFRKGIWGGKNGTIFPHYDEMTQASHAASDHAAIWADLDL